MQQKTRVCFCCKGKMLLQLHLKLLPPNKVYKTLNCLNPEAKPRNEIVQPEIGVITNIAEAHIKNFNSLQDIAKAKSEIIDNILKGGNIILNKDDKFFNFLFKKAKSHNLKICTFGKHYKSDVRIIKIMRIE